MVPLVLLTFALGLALRWDLATAALTRAGLDFAHLRHAHSHVGFYGFLTLAWWELSRRDLRFGRRTLHVYALLVVAATLAFGAMGYAPLTIVLSTVIAGFWLVAAWRGRRAPGWLGLVPVGVVLGMALIVPIAVTARRDLALSRELAHLFIAVMLFASFIPAALAALGASPPRRLAWLAATLGGSTYLVLGERLGLPFSLGWLNALGGALLIMALGRRLRTLPRPLAVTWLALAVGMALLGLIPALQTEANRITALHAAVLGPIALTALHRFAPTLSAERPVAFGVALTALVAMLGAMSAGPLLGHLVAARLAAGAGSALVLASVILLRRPLPATASGSGAGPRG